MDNILILYRELAGYVVECINHLASKHRVIVHLVAYPLASEAPFQFEFSAGVTLHSRSEMTRKNLQILVDRTKPELIFCAGWSDKLYLNLVKNNPHTPSLLAFDNQWTGSWRQRMGALYGRMKFLSLFNFAFVPGEKQRTFALKMGFTPQNTYTGVYACDLDMFNNIYEKTWNEKTSSWPRKLIYTGRYIEVKGVSDLFEAFAELVDEEGYDWELHGLGTGAIWEDRKIHPQIYHHGFVQPKDLPQHLAQCSIFVLPSHFEPWGVVVQEFAAAGFPLVLSKQIGAGTTFLEEGDNGLSFDAGSKQQLKDALRQIMCLETKRLRLMGEKSHKLAQSLSPEQWSKILIEMANQKPSKSKS